MTRLAAPIRDLAREIGAIAGPGPVNPGRWPSLVDTLLNDDPGVIELGLDELTELATHVLAESRGRAGQGVLTEWHRLSEADEALIEAVRDAPAALECALTVLLARYAVHHPRPSSHFHPYAAMQRLTSVLAGEDGDWLTRCVGAELEAADPERWHELKDAAAACRVTTAMRRWPDPEAAAVLADRARGLIEPWRSAFERCRASRPASDWARSNDTRWRLRVTEGFARTLVLVFSLLAADGHGWHLAHAYVYELVAGVDRAVRERPPSEVIDVVRHDLAWLLERAESDDPHMLDDPPMRGGAANRHRLLRARRRCFDRWAPGDAWGSSPAQGLMDAYVGLARTLGSRLP